MGRSAILGVRLRTLTGMIKKRTAVQEFYEETAGSVLDLDTCAARLQERHAMTSSYQRQWEGMHTSCT
jgi:hypothetical protein